MPKFDYNKSYDLAKRLLEKFGGAGLLEQTSFSTPDPTKPWDRVPATTQETITMCVVPLRKTDDFGTTGGQDITIGMSKGILLWPTGGELVMNDKLIYEGKTWIVGAAKPIKPASKGVIWVCQLTGQA